MQWRSAWIRAIFAPALAAITFAACTSDEGTTGPQIVSLKVVSGNGQVGQIGALLPQPLTVQVVDQHGNPVSGALVNFVASDSNGVVSPSVDTSASDGLVSTTWRLGPGVGTQTVEVSLVGQEPVSFFADASYFVNFSAVNVGGASACGLDINGVLYCWGSNNDGQVGIGSLPSGAPLIYTDPQPVAPVGDQVFGRVSGGRFHNCGVTTSHVGYCWGDNNNGQLGIGSDSRSATEPTLIDLGIPFATISAGRTHTCGLTIGGRPYCWGSNDRGQLGGNVTIDSAAGTVVLVSANTPKEVGSQTDGKFFGVYDFKAISAGGVHSCAVDFQHHVLCWGLGREGQLGDGGNAIDEYVPQLVSGNVAFDSIATGYNHSCGLATDGSAFCWGNNTEGQVGNGGSSNVNTPTAVSGQVFVAITAGFSHTCAITPAGTAYCWGRGAEGQLGSGGTAQSNVPQAVSGGLTFRSISAGDYATCGVTFTNVAYCWGDNSSGSLGDGTTTNRLVPTKVRSQP